MSRDQQLDRRSFLLGATTGAALAAVVAATAADAAGMWSAPPKQDLVSRRLTTIGVEEADIPNSGRGQLEWLEQPVDGPDGVWQDKYSRPNAAWQLIETRPGFYDWSIIDTLLEDVRQRQGRLNLRVMPMVYWGDVATWPSFLPTLTTVQPVLGSDGETKLRQYPDWNSEIYVDAWCNLVTAFGARYDTDPALFSWDLSGWSMFGEHLWSTKENGPAITEANMRRIIEATKAALPNTWTIAPARGLGTPAEPLMPQIYGRGGKWGHRYDYLGGVSVSEYQNYDETSWEGQWQYGPVLLEWGRNDGSGAVTIAAALSDLRGLHGSLISSPRAYEGNYDQRFSQLRTESDKTDWLTLQRTAGFRLALESIAVPATFRWGDLITVQTDWSNAGVAPTYDEWAVELWIGQRSVTLPIDLRTITPGAAGFTTQVRAPGFSGQPMRLRATHPYLPPLRLATVGRLDDGSYPIPA